MSQKPFIFAHEVDQGMVIQDSFPFTIKRVTKKGGVVTVFTEDYFYQMPEDFILDVIFRIGKKLFLQFPDTSTEITHGFYRTK